MKESYVSWFCPCVHVSWGPLLRSREVWTELPRQCQLHAWLQDLSVLGRGETLQAFRLCPLVSRTNEIAYEKQKLQSYWPNEFVCSKVLPFAFIGWMHASVSRAESAVERAYDWSLYGCRLVREVRKMLSLLKKTNIYCDFGRIMLIFFTLGNTWAKDFQESRTQSWLFQNVPKKINPGLIPVTIPKINFSG